jgi:hypothetical protein
MESRFVAKHRSAIAGVVLNRRRTSDQGPMGHADEETAESSRHEEISLSMIDP